jgi:general secretion pathway protein D
MTINLSGGTDVFAVPMNVQYDASKLTLLNVDSDDPRNPNVLGKDGQAVALAHRDDGKGTAAIAASRPPGTTRRHRIRHPLPCSPSRLKLRETHPWPLSGP